MIAEPAASWTRCVSTISTSVSPRLDEVARVLVARERAGDAADVLGDVGAGGVVHVADPEGRVHPEVVTVMRDLGIDLAERRPQRLSVALAERADVVVTMGCGDACPYIPGKHYLDWELPDPKGRSLNEVRATRDEIARRVEALAGELSAE